jgi:hypothetical protein
MVLHVKLFYHRALRLIVSFFFGQLEPKTKRERGTFAYRHFAGAGTQHTTHNVGGVQRHVDERQHDCEANPGEDTWEHRHARVLLSGPLYLPRQAHRQPHPKKLDRSWIICVWKLHTTHDM